MRQPAHYLAWFMIIAMIGFSEKELAVAEPPASVVSMNWSLLPGESLRQLAALIYPRDAAMQARFVRKTLQLNPALGADQVFDSPTELLIPDLKDFSRLAPAAASPGSTRFVATRRPAAVEQDAVPAATAELQASLEHLASRDQAVKQELDELDARLQASQNRLLQLKQMAEQNQADSQQPVLKSRRASEQSQAVNAAASEAGWLAGVASRLPALSWPSFKWQPWMLILIGLLLLIPLLAWMHSRRQTSAVILNKMPPAVGVNTFLAQEKAEVLRNIDVASELIGETQAVIDTARHLYNSGKPNDAIIELESHLMAQPKLSLHPWIYLLEIHRLQNNREEFSQVAKRMHQIFNVMVPAWSDEKISVVTADSLEEFPHIAASLVLAWPGAEAVQYLESLLNDNRDGDRLGFSLNVMQEIVLLLDILRLRAELR